MGLFQQVDTRKVLLFHSDDTFETKKLSVHDGSVVIKKDETILKGWPIVNKLMMRTKSEPLGFKKNERVMVINESDIIEDMFNVIPPEEKPDIGPGLVKDYVKEKADSVLYKHQSKPKSTTTLNRIILFLGIALTIFCFAILIKVLKG